MYAHFDGVVAEKLADSIVLDVNGVGYLLLVSAQTLSMAPSAGSAESEAIAALMALGYASSEAARAVSAVAGKAAKADEMIFLALKSLGS